MCPAVRVVPMTLRTAARSITGPTRSRNEDAVLAADVESAADDTCHLLAVADGMGGHRAGDVASEAAVEEFAAAVETDLADPATDGEVLVDGVGRAHDHLLELAKQHPGYEGMGTTLVGALVHDGGARIVNVGDSRAYHYAAGDLDQVTVDHTVVQELVEAGEITPAEARLHARRNVLTRSVGADERPAPDVFDLRLSGTLLLCSDGLVEALGETAIEAALDGDDTLDDRAAALADAAVDAGASDNITVALASLEGT